MERDSAVTIVRVLAALEWVGAAFSLLLTALFLVGGPLLASAIVAEEPTLATLGSGILAAVFIALGVFFFLLAVVGLLAGIGLWRLRNWGRIIALVTSWLSAVWGVFGTLGSATGGDATGVLMNVFGIAIAGVWIWLLQFQPDIVALFKAAPAGAVRPLRAASKKRR